jgi:hypothetical protein
MEQVAVCPKCGGDGTIWKDGRTIKCPKCGGTGEIRRWMGPSIASNTSKRPTVRKTTQLSPLGDYPDDKLDYYKPAKMFKKIEKANLPPAAEKVLKEKILKDNISTSVEDMAKNPLKKIGNVAKGGVAKTFGQLEQKYGKKKDLLKDMVDTSGTFLGAGGREPEKKKSSILGNLISKYKSKQSTEGSKGEAKQAAASSEKSENKEGEEQPGKITKGKVALILASIGGMVGGYFPFVQFFPELANSFLVVGGTSIAMITLAMFTKPKHQSVFIPLWLLVSTAGMYVTGSLNPVLPVFGSAVKDVKDIEKNLATGWTNLMCFMKTSDPNCWEPPTTEDQNVNKIGEYQTLQLSEGRRTTSGTIGNQKPVSGDRYSYDITLKNMNDKIYEINITNISAWAENETFPADHVYKGLNDTNPYILKPKEELPVTFMWGFRQDPDPGWKTFECPNSIITFKINISSRQYGGGFSNYGIAPSDEGDWIKFLHYFDPEVTAEPGPLNIYVYTEPYAIDWSYFSSQPFYIIIKITNPKVQDSVATLNELHLVQTFEAGSQFFNLDTGAADTCVDDLGNIYSLGTGLLKQDSCPSDKPFCNNYRFELENFDVNFDEGREIVCKATLNVAPTDAITDQIRVYVSYYDFKQKFVYPRSCKVETTAPITTTTI